MLTVALLYRVYVRNIPSKFRTNEDLTRFFQNCLSEDAVFESRIKAKLPNVTKLMQIRTQTLERLEYAVSAHEATGKRPTHKVKSKDGGNVEVDSIEGEIYSTATLVFSMTALTLSLLLV